MLTITPVVEDQGITQFIVSGDQADLERQIRVLTATLGCIGIAVAPDAPHEVREAMAAHSLQLAAVLQLWETKAQWKQLTDRARRALETTRTYLVARRTDFNRNHSLTGKALDQATTGEYAYFQYDWDTLLKPS